MYKVEIKGNYKGPGGSAHNINYRTKIRGETGRAEIDALTHHADPMADIHLRYVAARYSYSAMYNRR